MIAKPLRYVCLASYNCTCHPPGKPVSESTMKRHRDIANRFRCSKNLPILPRGTRYSSNAAQEHYKLRQKRDPVTFVEKVQEKAVGNGTDAYLDVVLKKDVSVLQIARDENEISPQLSQNNLENPLGAVTASPVVVSPYIDTEESFFSLADLMVSENEAEELAIITNDVQEVAVYENAAIEMEEEMDIDYFGRSGNSSAEIRFRSWAYEAKKWIQMYVEYGVRGNVMSNILNLIASPVSLITIRRNLLKFSGLVTKVYTTCAAHKLIDHYNANGLQENGTVEFSCDYCDAVGAVPCWKTFEYIPLLPRVKSWLGDEKSYKLLYEYMQSHLSKIDVENQPNYYEDFFNGILFRQIRSQYDGMEELMHDIFLSISCGGFQTFKNNSYESWPIIGMLLNLPPDVRFIVKNIVPFGFVKGPTKPAFLDTFFLPLLNEIKEINATGGTSIQIWNGKIVKIKVHIVFITADGPASQMLSGAVGGNGKSCCRFCNFHGQYCHRSRHYYYPSCIPIVNDNGRRSLEQLYDITKPRIRTSTEIYHTLDLIEDEISLTKSEREEIRRESGIKRRTTVLKLPSIVPYISFPLDTMHLFMNITKHMISLFKGDNLKIPIADGQKEPFIITTEGWNKIDKEIRNIPKGTSLDGFGTPTRDSTQYSNWKAIECRDFLLYYSTIVLDGYLPVPYMRGLSLLCCVARLCSKPSLDENDLIVLDDSARKFVKHFEERYYKYDLNRVSLCKSTIHALIHLKYTVELCEPLVCCNQYWMERYIGDRKEKLNAKTLPAESLTEGCKMIESYKLYYKEHFTVNEDSFQNYGHNEAQDKLIDYPVLLSPRNEEQIEDEFHAGMGTRSLLVKYLMGVEGLTEEEGIGATISKDIVSFGRMKVQSGTGLQIVGAKMARRHRLSLKRSDYYVSAQFFTGNQMHRDVYYGRILKIIQYVFNFGCKTSTRKLVIMDWVDRIQTNYVGEVFKASRIRNCFTQRSIEDCSVVMNAIGLLEHKNPSIRNVRTFFIDPHRNTLELLSENKASPDGINRSLRGLVGKSMA